MISIIIPVYNVKHYIARCIGSILNQTFQDFEVVIVNDSTPDNSIEIAKQLIGEDKRFIFVNNPENQGLMQTRKNGYKIAKGDYIIFCDSDDSLPENALEVLFNAIESSKSDIVIGNYLFLPTEGEPKKSNNIVTGGTDKISTYKSLLNRKFSHSLWGKIFNANLLRDFNYKTLLNFTNSEDAMLFYQIVENTKKIKCINDIVYNYYQNKESSTNVRLSNHSINSMFNLYPLLNYYGNKYRLEKLTNKYIYKDINSLLLRGYDYKLITSLINKHNLSKVKVFSNAVISCGFIKGFYYWSILRMKFVSDIQIFIYKLIYVDRRLICV